MNKIILTLIVCTMVFVSCSEDDIKTFGDSHYVYFEKFWKDANYPGTEKADSTNVTFFFAKETDEFVYADLKVVLAGKKPEKDLKFKLKVVDDLTTAQPDEYLLDDYYYFKKADIAEDATQIDATIKIQLNRSARLDEIDGYYLGLEIVPTEDFLPGQFERSRARLYITKDPVQPVWWTREVEEVLLGTYSSLKYSLFLRNVPGSEEIDEVMIKEHPDQVRKLVFDLKKWLSDNPTYDDNGSLLTVNI